MSAAAFQLVTARIKQALEGASLGQRVDRGRLKPVPQELNSVIVVRFDRASGRSISMEGATDWDVSIALDLYQRVTDGSDPEDAAGLLLNAVYQVVRTMDTVGLGVTSMAETPEIVATSSEDPSLTCLTLFTVVQVRTAPNTLNPQD